MLCFVSLRAKRQDDGYDFGMDRASLRDLITTALPLARSLTGDFWDFYVEHDQEMLYPLELFAALTFQCHGLSRLVEAQFRPPWPRYCLSG